MVHCSCSWALAQLLLAKLELAGRVAVPRFERWEGVESGMFPGSELFVSRKAGHISVTKKTGKR